jgi:cyclophilin family peptidyl-prolyl cis-trans isomerase
LNWPVRLAVLAALTLGAGCQAQTNAEEATDTASSQSTPSTSSTTQEAKRDPLQTIDAFIESENIDKSNPSWRLRVNRPPQAEFDPDSTYYWVLETNHGQIKIRLFPDVAPMHVSSTIYLTRIGFYDGLGFHRVIPGFMAQGGDPIGNGTGGPGYKYDGEFEQGVGHDGPGKLSMANAGPGTDGSQFFLTFTETSYLDGKHTVFGEVAEGMGTLRELEKRGSRSGAPQEPLEIRRATIVVE